MATIENFLLKFKVDGQQAIDKASTSIKGLSDQVAAFGANTGPLGSALGGIVGKLGPIGAAAGAAGAAFAALGLQAINLAAELEDIAGATGIASGTLLNFKTSVIEAGGRADDFAQIASKLNQSVQEAAGGNEKLQKAFKDLGVFVTDSSGKIRSTEAILRDITDKFQQGEISGKEYAAAIDILGKNINKLELAKLKAIADPVKTEEIKRLDEYAEAIDKLRDKLSRQLITFFGSAAEQLTKFMNQFEEAANRFERLEAEANKRGQTYRERTEGFMNRPLGGQERPLLSGQIVAIPERLRDMSPAELAAYRAARDKAEHEATMARLMAPYRPRPTEAAPGVNEGGGGFGAVPEATLKAIEENKNRIQQAGIEARKNADLLAQAEIFARQMRGANEAMAIDIKRENDIKNIRINSNAEIQKAIEEIRKKERLDESQIQAEIAAKTKEIRSKAALDEQRVREKAIEDAAKLQMQTNAKVFAEEEAQREANRQAIAAYEQQVQAAAETARQQAENYKKSREDLEDQIMLENELRGMNRIQADTQRKIAEEIQRRTRALEELARVENLSYEERVKRENQIREDSAGIIEIIRKQGAEDYNRSQSFAVGWTEAFDAYREAAMSNAEIAKNSLQNATQSMEDALVRFVMTGKLSFKDFAQSVLADLARIAAKRAIVFFASKMLPGLADGGPAFANQPYIVGERGPELFVPKTAGTVIPNDALQGSGGRGLGLGQASVTYNINAVDAASFRALVARDPSFIYSVTEQGRRSQPTRSR